MGWRHIVFILLLGFLGACAGSSSTASSEKKAVTPGGSGDTSVPVNFDLREGANDDVWGTVEVNDGEKIYVYGEFTQYNGRTHNRLVRLHADGTEDDSFDIGWGFNGRVRAVLPSQSAPGKIYVGGDFAEMNGKVAQRMVRLNENGTVDTVFDVRDGFNDSVTSIIADPNSTAGDVYVGGFFDTYQGEPYARLLRLKVDGSIDRDFNTRQKMRLAGRGRHHSVAVLMSSPDRDSKDIYVGGQFVWYDENQDGVMQDEERVGNLIRVNDEGRLDPNFRFYPRRYPSLIDAPSLEIGFSTGPVYALAPVGEDTEDILVGGAFSRYRDQEKHYNIIRLRNNGDIGVESNFGKGFDGIVRSITMVNGKIMVGGDFTRYKDSLPARRIARVNLNGTLDDSFAAGAGFNQRVLSIVQVMNSDFVYVSGAFDLYRETFYGSYIRLDGAAEVAVD